jgi:flagellar export protein FliJ
MRPPDSIQILLRVRCRREEIEERKLAAIVEKLKAAQAELANLSAELKCITTTRLHEVQGILPNTHHQAVEAHSRSLWRQCADRVAEIEKLKEVQAQQMSAYLSAHREREVMESLNKRRRDALEAERQVREQKLNEDLFLARRVAKWDT